MNVTIIWDDADDPRGNVAHIGEHGFTVDDVEFVVENATFETVSKRSGRPCVFGDTPAGEHVIVVFEEVDESTIYPVTCYEVPERRRRR
ncbi:MAG: hypothetical protein WD403_09270 [Pirellulales bacterium]